MALMSHNRRSTHGSRPTGGGDQTRVRPLPAATPRPCPGHGRHVGSLSAHCTPHNGTPHAAHGVRPHPAACAVGVQGVRPHPAGPDPHPRLPGLIAADQGHFADRARTSQSPQTLRSDSGLCEDPVTPRHVVGAFLVTVAAGPLKTGTDINRGDAPAHDDPVDRDGPADQGTTPQPTEPPAAAVSNRG